MNLRGMMTNLALSLIVFGLCQMAEIATNQDFVPIPYYCTNEDKAVSNQSCPFNSVGDIYKYSVAYIIARLTDCEL